MNRLVIATQNGHKVREIRDILQELPFEVVSLRDLSIDVDVEEDGATFEANAYKKAAEIMKITGEMVLSDDSGLEVDALDGAPGVLSARFAGVHGNDKDNNKKLLQLLKNIPDNKRGAQFVSVIVLLSPDGDKIATRGEVRGYIGHEEKGSNGFGYDPLFIVPEYGKTFAELSEEEKNRISHRGKALEKLKDMLMQRK